MQKFTCVYCLEKKGEPEFNREHVIPESMGSFTESNLVLNEHQVCAACNSFFGEKLDLYLGRDSLEALYRFRYGLKLLGDTKDLRYRRLQVRYNGAGDLNGMFVAISPKKSEGGFNIELVSQVGFRQKQLSRYVYYRLRDLEAGRYNQDSALDMTRDYIVVAKNRRDQNRILQILKEVNMKPRLIEKSEISLPDDGEAAMVQVVAELDEVICRAIAKIGFNYMTYCAGVDFALNSDFNLVRKFIRYGKMPPDGLSAFMKPSEELILANEFGRYRKAGVHVLALQWDYSLHHVLADVSLFNAISWRIVLARNFGGVFRDIKRAYRFDLENHRVEPLKCIDRRLLP